MCFNNDETPNEVATERQAFGSSEEDESRVEDSTGNANNLLQISQQRQPLAPIVKWERYLPVRSLKVLLVENDDSTRHIVTALLWNCSYEVMSSHDSMVLVFKCLSNGAVDFLVKPIRKNELKNLWQHVWRRCHSSSGSGSVSEIQNKKSVKTESTEGSENDANISDEEHGNENGSNGLSNGDGESDNGSGTQSSWTKRVNDINTTLPKYQLPDAPNVYLGTCRNAREHVNKLKEVEDQNVQIDDVPIGTGSQAGMPMSKKAEEPGNLEKDAKYYVQALERNSDDMLNRSSGNLKVESKSHLSNPEDLESLELTLTKPREVGGCRISDPSVLRHSNHSAFSKYNSGVISANKAPKENVASSPPHDSSVAKMMAGWSSDNPLKSSGSERAAQREAALMKFRLKRKERCFEKKVRYHSRRKLAEQRPRVKGQFIRKRDDSKS